MGNHHSHPKKPVTEHVHKPAVFPLDTNEPILTTRFEVTTERMILPIMPEPEVAPAVPNLPPPPRHVQTMPTLKPRDKGKPLPPIPVFPRPVRPTVPNHILKPKIGDNDIPKPLERNGSNVSTISSPDLRRPIGAHPSEHDDRDLLIATHRFLSLAENEINLEEGDQVYLLHQTTSDWWYVETKAKRRGFVPKSHIKRIDVHEDWFAGNIPRIVAVRRVMQPNLPIGTFLIRENPTRKTFVLTVRSSSEQHRNYEIFHKDGSFYMTDANFDPIISFNSLNQLVKRFKEPLGSNDVNICTRLTVPAPVIRETDDETYVTMRNWQIDRNSITLGESIGSGQFGEVFRAKFQNFDVAVKRLKRQYNDEDSKNVEDFIKEAKFLALLNHPNLIKLIAVCSVEHPYYIVTELMENGSLLKFLQLGVKHNKMTTESAMNIAAQVASGMSYLAANKFIHRDLAARNVLVGQISSNHIPLVKVADFGLARRLKLGENEYGMTQDTKLAVKWMAPEAYDNKTFNTQSDVWSFGILIWEIGTMGKTPYEDWSAKYTIEKVRDDMYRLPRPDGIPEFVYQDAFLKCLDADPNKRPTFDQLFKYFDDDIRISQVKRYRTNSLIV